MRAAIARGAAMAQLAAALMLVVLAVRFSVSAVIRSVADENPGLRPAQSASATPPPPSVTTAKPKPAPAPEVPQAVVGSSLRVPIVVSVGPDRSELYVNGVRVGHSPFVGEVSCKAGEKVKIELVPPRGSPQVYERRCAPGTLRVSD
jgi:hypothetical protein